MYVIIIQLGVAEPGYICTERNSETEICLDERIRNQLIKKVYISRYTFILNSNSNNINYNITNNIMFNISPDCGNPSSGPIKSSSRPIKSSSAAVSTSNPASRNLSQECIPGCICNPLQVYINICPSSKCSIRDKYPSSYSGRYDYNRTLITRETHTGKIYIILVYIY